MAQDDKEVPNINCLKWFLLLCIISAYFMQTVFVILTTTDTHKINENIYYWSMSEPDRQKFKNYAERCKLFIRAVGLVTVQAHIIGAIGTFRDDFYLTITYGFVMGLLTVISIGPSYLALLNIGSSVMNMGITYYIFINAWEIYKRIPYEDMPIKIDVAEIEKNGL